jgi:predicted peptidase
VITKLVWPAAVLVTLQLLRAGCRSPAVDRSHLVTGKVTNGRLMLAYAVALPSNYSPQKRWPVILFLHGFGERGEDGISQTRGMGTFLHRYPDRFPCLVVMPQLPRIRVRWEGEANELALKALDEVVSRYHGDEHRLYLTGCSMGGGGCWRIAAAHPGRFAAVMPVCGHTEPATQAPRLQSLPIWAFHGAEDPIVPVRYSRAMVQALRSAGSTKIRYTEYPGVGHDCWDRTYADPRVLRWLLAQRR